MEQKPTRKELGARIVARAWADPEFKQQLLSNPRAAIQAETGIDLPDVFEVIVIEETPTRGCLVLPLNMSELTEQELDLVAAGGGCDCD